MADESIKKETTPFNLGIENSQVYGDIKAAESFLSGANPDDIKEIDNTEEEEQEVKKEDKKETKKVPENKEIDVFAELGDDKDNEEDDTKDAEEDTKEEDNKEIDTKEEDLNYFEVFSEELYKLGSFTTDDGEEKVIAKTPEEFVDLFNSQKQKGATEWLENFLSKHGEDRRELFEAIFINGVDPEKYLPTYNEVVNFENIDIDKEENQESVIRAYYTRMGWEKGEVDQKVEKLKQYADLEDEAKRVHPKLVQQDKQKLEQIADEAKQKEADKLETDTNYRKAIVTTLQEKLKTKDFDGIPLDKNTADKVYDYLYTKKWKLPSGELLTDYDKSVLESKDPANISKRIKMALLDLNNFDFSKIKKSAISTESGKLFNKLVTKDTKKSNTTKTASTSTWDNI